MTIVSVVMSRYCTAHASDSFISPRLKKSNKYRLKSDDQKTKVVRVLRWRGALSYWGLAGTALKRGGRYQWSWSTLQWLREQAQRADSFSSPEEFANAVAGDLNTLIAALPYDPGRPLATGIGIHFTAYEYVNHYWIPELFLISNFTHDVYHPTLYRDGIHCSRQTYNVIKQIETGQDVASQSEHRDPVFRQYVHQYLQSGKMLIYNNGDPVMFNPVAYAILTLLSTIALAASSDPATYRRIARRPIEVVSDIQHDFMHEDKRLVGGRMHDLSVTPKGEYGSDTGD
jgi:hypothetical protein